MIQLQATRGQLVGVALALIIGIAGTLGAVTYVNGAYAAAADHTHSVAQAR